MIRQRHKRLATSVTQALFLCQYHLFAEKVEEAFVIHTLQVQLINPYESPTFQNPNHPVEVYPEQEILSGEALLVQVLEHLALSREAVLDWYHWQDEQQQLHLELYARYPLVHKTVERMPGISLMLCQPFRGMLCQ